MLVRLSPHLSFLLVLSCASACAPPERVDYRVTRLLLPQSRALLADINGDQSVENQIAEVLTLLDLLNPQEKLDQATGQRIVAITLQATLPPTDIFWLSELAVGPLPLREEGVRWKSPDAWTQTPDPFAMDLALPLFDDVLVVHLVGFQIQISTASTDQLTGSIHGATLQRPFAEAFIPRLLGAFSKIVTAKPTTPDAMTLLNYFDTGGTPDGACAAAGVCTEETGQCAVKQDGVISKCELVTSPRVKKVMGADVQMYDSDGHYAPSAINGAPDSLSIGIGFTAWRQ